MNNIGNSSFQTGSRLRIWKNKGKPGKSRNTIGTYDLMIGARTLEENLTLVTNNQKEFSRIYNIII